MKVCPKYIDWRDSWLLNLYARSVTKKLFPCRWNKVPCRHRHGPESSKSARSCSECYRGHWPQLLYQSVQPWRSYLYSQVKWRAAFLWQVQISETKEEHTSCGLRVMLWYSNKFHATHFTWSISEWAILTKISDFPQFFKINIGMAPLNRPLSLSFKSFSSQHS
jgi:hypothetical protein